MVHWTYPADGDRDVPTNAVLWVIGNLSPTEVLLDDQPIKNQYVSFGASRYVPDQELAADSDHVLRIAASDDTVAADGGVSEVVIHFHTSAGPAQRPAPSKQATYQSTLGFPNEHRCVQIISAQDCFDTGQDTLASFDIQGEALAWVVQSDYLGESTVWPATCGAPAVFGHAFADCFQVSALGRGGLLSSPVPACPAPAQPTQDQDHGQDTDAGVDSRMDAGTVSHSGDTMIVGLPVEAPPQSRSEQPGIAGHGAMRASNDSTQVRTTREGSSSCQAIRVRGHGASALGYACLLFVVSLARRRRFVRPQA
jgi:hypothetical protein